MSQFSRQFAPLYERWRADIHIFAAEGMNFEATWQQKELFDLVQMETMLPEEQRLKRIAVRSGQGPGKCILEGTSVLDLRTGRRQTVGQLVGRSQNGGESFTVPSMNTTTECIAAAEATAFPSGEKPCVEVQLKSGQWLEASTDHPIYTPNGWVRAEDLKPGDFVATPRRLPAPEAELDVTDEEVKIVAYMMSDGCTSDTNSRFTQMDGPVLDEMRTLVDMSHSANYDYNVRGIRPLMRSLGLQGCKAVNKRIPDTYFGLSNEQLGLFINRFWACDGYFTKDGPEMVLANRQLILDFQTLLLRFGIQSRFSYKAAKCEGKSFDAWRLRICGGENIRLWAQHVGEVLGKEGRIPEAKPQNTNTDVVPEAFSILEDIDVSPSEARAAGFRAREGNNWSRAKTQACLAHFGKQHRRGDNDILWSKVARVTDIGAHSVFDLEVPENGNFVANNIIIHNTAASVVVAAWRGIQYEDALCIVTSPSMRQCKQWIDEFRRLLKNAHPLLQKFIETFDTKVQINKSSMWEIRTATATRPENLQGVHEKNLTFIADEGSGVGRSIFETIKGTLSNPNSLFLTIGNPNTTDCTFYDCFTQHADQWHKLCWNAEDTARDYPGHLSPQRNAQLAKEYGRDSDVYRVRVLGEFPHQNPNSIMALQDIMACTKTSKIGCAGLTSFLPVSRAIGIDYARYGSDESVVAARQGLAVVEWKTFTKTDPREVTDYAFLIQYDRGWANIDCWYLPDAGGIGQGIVHSFAEAGKQRLEFFTQARAADSSMFADQYSEAWWCFRQLTRERIVHIPNDPRLIKQLSTREYYMDRKGRIKVESKDEWRKRTETSESPDRADAIIMCFYPFVGNESTSFTMPTSDHVVGSSVRRSR